MTLAAYIGLFSAWILAMIVPGPDTLQLVRLAARARRNAFMASLGITTGNLIWPVVTMLGLAALINTFPWLLAVLYIGGGLFLTKMGVGAFRSGLAQLRQRSAGQKTDLQRETELLLNREGFVEGGVGGDSGAGADGETGADTAGTGAPAALAPYSDAKAYRIGLATNLSNPKALLFFASVFAQFLPLDADWGTRLLVLFISTVMCVAWFFSFSWLVSLRLWADRLQRANVWIELFAGVLFAGLGLVLLVEGLLKFF